MRKQHKNGNGTRQRAQRLSPDERRPQLLACALRVFARRGLNGARHAEIADEAGVSLSTVFFYFPTRAVLVQDVLAEVDRFFCALVEQVQARNLSAAQTLSSFATALVELVDTHPDYARVCLDWSTAVREDLWPQYIAFQERMVEKLAETIERGRQEGAIAATVNTEDVGRFLVGSAYMVIQMKLAHCAPEKVTRFLHTLLQVALSGVEKDAASYPYAPLHGAARNS